MSLVYRTNGAWGSGTGANLSPAQIDNNIYELAQQIVDLQNADAPQPDNIANVTVSGATFSIVLMSGTVIGPLPLPIVTIRFRGEWTPDTLYQELDFVKVTGSGLYLVMADHTSDSVFDPDEVNSNGALYQLTFALDQPPSLEALSDVSIPSGSPRNGDFLVFETDSNDANGSWEVRSTDQVNQLFSFNELNDVDISDGVAVDDVPIWNGIKWVPGPQTSGGGGGTSGGVDLLSQLGDVDLTIGLSDGDGLVYNESAQRWMAVPVQIGDPGTEESDQLISLASLTDVAIDSSVADGDILTFNEGTQKWEPQPASGGGSAGGGGGSFTDAGTWNTSDGYDPFDVVQHAIDSTGAKSFLCWNTVAAAAATPPSVGESAKTTFGGTGGTVSLTTTAAGEVVVFILLNQSSARNVVSVVGGTLGSFTKRGGGPLNWNADGSWVGDLEEWHATSSGSLSSENITITTDSSVDCAAAIAFNVIGYTDFDADGSLPVNVNTATLAYSTSNAADLLLYASGAEGNGNYQDVPTGFTQIDTVIDSSHGLRFASLRVSYKAVTTLDSSGAFGGASGSNFVNFFDAIAGVGAENTEPQHDPGHWIGGG